MHLSNPTLADVEHLIHKARELGLDDNGIFTEYTSEEMVANYNGIGPDWFPSWLRSWLSSLYKVILPAALIHDMDFVRGGSRQAFRMSNHRFGRNSKRCIKAKYPAFSLKRWFYLAKTHVFVRLCNKYGQYGWNFN